MPFTADEVAHLYKVLGLPPSATTEQVHDAERKIYLEYQQTARQSGAEGAQARALLEAAAYARDQLEAIRKTGGRTTIPDRVTAERERAGCLVPLGLAAGLFLFSNIAQRIHASQEAAVSSPPVPATVPDGEGTATSTDHFTDTSTSGVPTPTATPAAETDQATPQLEEIEPQSSNASSETQDLQSPVQLSNDEEQDPFATPQTSVSDPVPVAPDTSDTANSNSNESQSEGDQIQSTVSPDDPEAGAIPAAPTGTFTLGSTKEDVENVMGMPATQYGDTWAYDGSTVTFRNGRVVSYSNPLGSLKIVIEPKIRSPKTEFTLGDSQDVVLSVMGTPATQYGDTWAYDGATVTFQNGQVVSYSNPLGSLKIVIEPRVRSSKTVFTLGDDQDVVLSVMGTPATQYGDTWSYNGDSVTFQNGQVVSYSNPLHSLKIVIEPKVRSSKTAFAVGDSQDVVLSVMGAPAAQYGSTWSYDGDSVTFRNGRVVSYSNPLGSLKLQR